MANVTGTVIRVVIGVARDGGSLPVIGPDLISHPAESVPGGEIVGSVIEHINNWTYPLFPSAPIGFRDDRLYRKTIS